MMERTVPWWRRALKFALGGITGLFRRNGKAAAGEGTALPPAARPLEEPTIESEPPQSEHRGTPAFPPGEPDAADAMATPEMEPPIEVVAAWEEPAVEEMDLSADGFAAELPAFPDEPPRSEPAATEQESVAPEPAVLAASEPLPVDGIEEEAGEEETGEEEAGEEVEVIEPETALTLPAGVFTAPAEVLTAEAACDESIPAVDRDGAIEILPEAAVEEAAAPEAVAALDPWDGMSPAITSEPASPAQSEEETVRIPEAAEEAELAEKAVAATSAPANETTETGESASAEEMSQAIEIAAEAEPEEMALPQVEWTSEDEITLVIASSGEPESTQPAEAAPAEEVSAAVEVDAAAQEPTAPQPADEMREPFAEESEAAAAAEAPVPEPLPPEPLPVPEPPLPGPLPTPEPPPMPEPPPAPPQPAAQEAAPTLTLPFAEKPGRTTAEKVAAAMKAREARGEDADQSPFSVNVNQVYDGPLDLLLDLIRKQDIDIYDIPIAKITAQFLAYVDHLRASDMDVAGEFIYTAALLIHIKSKMLLPRAPAGPDDAAEDPRRELVERLLEHERFKNAAQMLLEKQMLEAATLTNPGMREFQEDSKAEPEIAADTTDLVRVFSRILERARNRPIINVEEDSVTVGQMIQFLARRLTMEDRPVALGRMLSHTKSERALIAMFLALLELVRLQAILLRQDRHFSEIFIKKHTSFDALMNQGLAGAHDDWR